MAGNTAQTEQIKSKGISFHVLIPLILFIFLGHIEKISGN